MKIKFISLFLIILFVFTGCNFQIPEKVSVKTNAEYNLSLGSINKEFEIDAFNDLIESADSDISLYDYFPAEKDGSVQQFLMDIPIQEIPLDFSAYFSNSDIASSIRELSFEKEIEVPEIQKEISITVDSEYVNTAINSMLYVTGVPTTNTLVLFGISNFDSITYETGYFDIDCDVPNGLTAYLSSDGITLAATFINNKATFDLDGFTMKNDAVIRFSSSSTSPYVGYVRSGSKIENAQGVDASFPLPIQAPINLSDTSSVLENAVIGAGQIKTVMSVPESWTNFSCEYGITVTGAINITSPSNSNKTKTVSLAGKTITPSTANFESSINIQFAHSYISFEKPLEIKVSCSVESFDTINIRTNGIQTELSRQDTFTEALLTTIKKLMIGQSGIKGTYVNTLPAGNDIVLTANSNFFDINNINQNLICGKIDEPFELLSPQNLEKLINIKEHPVQPDEYNGWDFLVKIQLPGSTPSNPNRITLHSVSSGAKYKIKIAFTPELNWKYITINANTVPNRMELPLEFSFSRLTDNINSVLGLDFTNNFMLKELPLYIMVEEPEIEGDDGNNIFANSKYRGEISIFYGKQVGDEIVKQRDENGDVIQKRILGAGLANNGIMTFVDTPEREFKDNTNIVITDYSKCAHSIETDLIDLLDIPSIEDDDVQLYISYELNFTNDENSEEIIITKEMYDNCENLRTSIKIHGMVIIPFAFKVVGNQDVDINFNELLNISSTDDIFGRDSASSLGVLKDYIDVVDSFSIDYALNKMPIHSIPSVMINVKLFPDEEPKQFKLTEGKITLPSQKIDKLLNTYPLCPTVDFHFKRGTEFSIARKMALDLKLQLQLKTDGTINF